MSYVDGFVTPVPKKKISAYKRVSNRFGRILRELGALEFRECIADDVKWGKRTSFPRSVKQKPSEISWFSWIIYKSRAHRDAVNKKVMAQMQKEMPPKKMPFDFKRMAFGGFKALVEY